MTKRSNNQFFSHPHQPSVVISIGRAPQTITQCCEGEASEKFPIPSANVTFCWISLGLFGSHILLYRLFCFLPSFPFSSFIKTDTETHTHTCDDVTKAKRRSEMERAQALRACIGVGASRFDVLCVDIFFFGFFGISVPLHIVVRINSIEILFFFLVLLSRVFFPLLRSEEEGKISIFFDNKNCFSLQSLTRKNKWWKAVGERRARERKHSENKISGMLDDSSLGGHYEASDSTDNGQSDHVTSGEQGTFTVDTAQKHVFLSSIVFFKFIFPQKHTKTGRKANEMKHISMFSISEVSLSLECLVGWWTAEPRERKCSAKRVIFFPFPVFKFDLTLTDSCCCSGGRRTLLCVDSVRSFWKLIMQKRVQQ